MGTSYQTQANNFVKKFISLTKSGKFRKDKLKLLINCLTDEQNRAILGSQVCPYHKLFNLCYLFDYLMLDELQIAIVEMHMKMVD